MLQFLPASLREELPDARLVTEEGHVKFLFLPLIVHFDLDVKVILVH